jgi:hypothetical protein
METALEVVTNVEALNPPGYDYTTGWIVPAGTPTDSDLSQAAVDHINIPDTEDYDEWRQGLRNALDAAGYATDDTDSQDGPVFTAPVTRLGVRHYTAWLTTDPDYLDGGLVDVVVLRDVVTRSYVDDDGNEQTIWESRGLPLMSATTTVDGEYGNHHDAQDQAAALLTNAGWWAVDWTWAPVPAGYVLNVERADA